MARACHVIRGGGSVLVAYLVTVVMCPLVAVAAAPRPLLRRRAPRCAGFWQCSGRCALQQETAVAMLPPQQQRLGAPEANPGRACSVGCKTDFGRSLGAPLTPRAARGDAPLNTERGGWRGEALDGSASPQLVSETERGGGEGGTRGVEYRWGMGAVAGFLNWASPRPRQNQPQFNLELVLCFFFLGGPFLWPGSTSAPVGMPDGNAQPLPMASFHPRNPVVHPVPRSSAATATGRARHGCRLPRGWPARGGSRFADLSTTVLSKRRRRRGPARVAPKGLGVAPAASPAEPAATHPPGRRWCPVGPAGLAGWGAPPQSGTASGCQLHPLTTAPPHRTPPPRLRTVAAPPPGLRGL